MPALREGEAEAGIKRCRDRKEQLQEQAMKLAMQINKSSTTATTRMRQAGHSSSLTLGVTAAKRRNLKVDQSNELNDETKHQRESIVESTRMLQKENRIRNNRTQIHNIKYGAASSEVLREERDRRLRERNPDIDLTLSEIQKLENYLSAKLYRK
jgi:superfamily II DNA helicase RecQ